MTPLEKVATVALFAAFLVACFRARWVALAIAPPALLTLAAITGLVDISSASHPLRIGTALLGLSLSMWAAWREASLPRTLQEAEKWVGARVWSAFEHLHHRVRLRNPRALVAAILVFASYCVDIPALFTWQIPGVWVLIPIQIAVCAAVIFVLLAPERWLSRWLQ